MTTPDDLIRDAVATIHDAGGEVILDGVPRARPLSHPLAVARPADVPLDCPNGHGEMEFGVTVPGCAGAFGASRAATVKPNGRLLMFTIAWTLDWWCPECDHHGSVELDPTTGGPC